MYQVLLFRAGDENVDLRMDRQLANLLCIPTCLSRINSHERSGESKNNVLHILDKVGSAGFNKVMSIYPNCSFALSAGQAPSIKTARRTEAETEMHLGAPGVPTPTPFSKEKGVCFN